MKNRLEELSQKIDKSQSGLDTVMPVFRDLYTAYKAMLNEEVIKYMDNMGKSRVPYYLIMNKLQKINAKMIEAYFSNKQFAKINEKRNIKKTVSIPLAGQLIEVNINNVEMIKAAIDALQFAVDYYTTEDDESQIYHALTLAFEDLQIYGTCIIKADWAENLVCERIHIKDIKFDVEAENQNQLEYAVHDIYLTKEKILSLRDKGVFGNFNAEDIKPTETDNQNQVKDAKRIKLQEVYEKIDGAWYVSTIYDKKVILRDKVALPMGFPFIIGKLKNQKNNPDGTENGTTVMIYGDTIIAPLIPLQREMTILRNQMLEDATEKTRWIIKDNTINPFDFTNRNIPAIKTKGNPQTDFKEIPTGNSRDKQYNVDKIEIESQEAIGVVDYGANSGKQMNKTATGMSILTEESNTILQFLLRNCNETLIKPLFRRITQLVWAYGSQDLFYGIDRNMDLEYTIGVDVGLGATNKQQQLEAKNVALAKMMEFATMKMQVGIGGAEEILRAEKFLHNEIFPLMGIENFEEYSNDNNRQDGNIAENPNMGTNFEQSGGMQEGFN